MEYQHMQSRQAEYQRILMEAAAQKYAATTAKGNASEATETAEGAKEEEDKKQPAEWNK